MDQDNSGKINTILALIEEPVNPKVATVLEKYHILVNPSELLPPTRANIHLIRSFDEASLPPKQRQYCPTLEEPQAIRDNIDLYLQHGWIRPSCSLYGHPVLIIRKKDSKLRMVVDYRFLNSKTISDRFLLPRIDDILDSLGKSMVFTKLDLDSGYHLVDLDPKDVHKIAFLSKWGLYEYTVLLLGLPNAPATI